MLISNHGPYYRLVEHLARYTQKKIGIALGVPAMTGFFDDRHYEELPGRTLESVGRLFARNVRMYVYPRWDPATQALITTETLEVPHEFRHLYSHVLDNGYVVPIRQTNPEYQSIDSDEVLRLIQSGDPSWTRWSPLRSPPRSSRSSSSAGNPAERASAPFLFLFGWAQVRLRSTLEGHLSQPVAAPASHEADDSLECIAVEILEPFFPRERILNAADDGDQVGLRHRAMDLLIRERRNAFEIERRDGFRLRLLAVHHGLYRHS